MGMTRREFRGLAVLAALLALIVTITAITQCSRQKHRAGATQEQIAPAGEADSNAVATDKNIVGLATRGGLRRNKFSPYPAIRCRTKQLRKIYSKKACQPESHKTKAGPQGETHAARP